MSCVKNFAHSSNIWTLLNLPQHIMHYIIETIHFETVSQILEHLR